MVVIKFHSAARFLCAILAFITAILLSGCSTGNEIKEAAFQSDGKNHAKSEKEKKEAELGNMVGGSVGVAKDANSAGEPGGVLDHDINKDSRWAIPNNLLFTYKRHLLEAVGASPDSWKDGVSANREFLIKSDLSNQDYLLAANVLNTITKLKKKIIKKSFRLTKQSKSHRIS